MQRGQYGVLCNRCQLLPNFARLIAIASVVPVVSVLFAVAIEMRSVKGRRVSVSRFEVAHEMTLVVKSDLERDLLNTQKT